MLNRFNRVSYDKNNPIQNENDTLALGEERKRRRGDMSAKLIPLAEVSPNALGVDFPTSNIINNPHFLSAGSDSGASRGQ